LRIFVEKSEADALMRDFFQTCQFLCHGLPVKLENGSGGSAQKVMIEIYVESEYLQDFQDELAEVLGGDPLSFIIPTL